MIRDWIRAFRHKGIMAFLMPVLVIILMVSAYIEYVDDYFAHLEEAEQVSSKLEATNEVIRIAKEMDKRKIVLKPDYDLWQSRAFIAPTREEASKAIQANLTQILQSLYFEKITIEELKEIKGVVATNTSTDLLMLEAKFIGVPQQLPRLEAELQTQAKTIRLGDVKIKAIIPPKPVAAKPSSKKAKEKTASEPAAPANNDPYLEITARFVVPYLATSAVVTATAPMPAASVASKPLPNTK
ncbi:MAG: hypothetical protein RIR79_1983 [Pseudomonadota bacterium]